MLPENVVFNDADNNEELSSSTSNIGGSHSSDTVTVQGTTFTQEEIEEANKPQPNVILNSTGDGNPEAGSSYRDPERVSPRSNEAADSTDTNTGGIISGAAKGTAQS